MHFIHRLLLSLSTCVLLTNSALAAVVGQIDARLVITAGCQVSLGGALGGASERVAILDFGTQGPAWNAPSSSPLSSNNGALAIVCGSPGNNPTQFAITIDGGAHGDGSARYMSNGSHRIPYDLSADAVGHDRYSVGQQRTFTVGTGGATPVPIYGALPRNTRLMPAGLYRDTVTVTLNW